MRQTTNKVTLKWSVGRKAPESFGYLMKSQADVLCIGAAQTENPIQS